MWVACRMFHAVDNLAGLLDPMPRRVQVVPCAVRVIFEIVKGAVGLGFDGDGALCRKGRAGQQPDDGQQTHKQRHDAFGCHVDCLQIGFCVCKKRLVALEY